MTNESAIRRARANEQFPEHKLDALLVSSLPNLRYLTGFTGSNGMLLLLPDNALFFTDPRYTLQAEQEVDCPIRVATGPLLIDVLHAVRRRRVRSLGFEQAHCTCSNFEFLRAKLPLATSLRPVIGLIEDLRSIKSPSEIEKIRRSVLTNSRAFEQTLSRLKPGMTETDLAAEFEYRMRRAGAEKPAFETIVAGGKRSALPHAQPGKAKLEGLVVVDMGTFEDGYASDMTRMLHIGTPGPKARKLYRAVLEAQLAALDAVRAGAATAFVNRQARRVLRGHGLDKAFTHSTGHGLGLEIHERPRLGKTDKTKLAAGMAITIEPGAYLESFGGVRIEDTVIVTEQGCEVLTPSSKDLRVY